MKWHTGCWSLAYKIATSERASDRNSNFIFFLWFLDTFNWNWQLKFCMEVLLDMLYKWANIRCFFNMTTFLFSMLSSGFWHGVVSHSQEVTSIFKECIASIFKVKWPRHTASQPTRRQSMSSLPREPRISNSFWLTYPIYLTLVWHDSVIGEP
jgi:hypothetical protein